METNKKEELEKLDLFFLFRDVAKQFRNLWWVVLLLIALFGGFLFLRARRSYAPIYETETIFTVRSNLENQIDLTDFNYYYDSQAAKLSADTFPYVLRSDVMRERMKIVLGTPFINGTMTTSTIPGTNFLVLTVRSGSAEDACAVSEAVIRVYPEIISSLLGNIQMAISQPPVVPSAPCNAFSWHGAVAQGMILGALVGAVLLTLLALINQTVVSPEDVKKQINLSCLAEIPNVIPKHRSSKKDLPLLLSNQEPDSAFSESFRLLRLKLLRQLGPEDKVLLFTSSMPAEGKTSLAVNTALSLARDGKQVLLIDGDLRAQSIKAMLGIREQSSGLQEFLEGETQEICFLHDDDSSLYLLLSSKTCSNPTHLFRYDLLDRLMKALRSRFDYIIIDTPPAAMMADAAALARHSDQVIYVIRSDYATRPQLVDGVQAISGSETPIAGFVLNRVRATGGTYHGYGYSGKYGYSYKYGNSGSGSHYGDYHKKS